MTEHSVLHLASSVEQDRWGLEGVSDQGGADGSLSPHDVTIMLVEDEPMVRNVICRALRREGYQIVDAGDGAEAIDMLDLNPRRPIHLLITDLDMPRIGGLDLARHLRAVNRVQRVIFMTGDIFRPMPPSGLSSALLRKPFNLQQLAMAVRDMLGR